jgi:hypothetical protein
LILPPIVVLILTRFGIPVSTTFLILTSFAASHRGDKHRSQYMPDTITTSPVTLEQYRAMDMAGKRQVWLEISDISEAEFEAHIAAQMARESNVPKVGEVAPDFVADVLDRGRQRTGEQVRLSDLRGKPVGIVFGSFT